MRINCIASRDDRLNNRINGILRYYHHKSNDITLINEDSRLCDGIGGVIWDGSLIMSYILEDIIPNIVSETTTIELGAGSGMCSIVTSKCSLPEANIKVISTDRYIDLLEINTANNNLNNRITCNVLNWDNPEDSLMKPIDENIPLIIYGVEIACLVKQQHKLINTIKSLCQDNTNSVIFITFDEYPSNESNYEKQFIQLMKNEKFIHSIIFTGSIIWDDHESVGYLDDITSQYDNDLHRLSFPTSRHENRIIQKESYICSNNEPPPIPILGINNNKNTKSTHHVIAFYKNSSTRTCKTCHKQYFPFLRDPCCYHKGLFVCRFHPSETKSNSDKKRVEAKAWDCCGSEDENGRGCFWSQHTGF